MMQYVKQELVTPPAIENVGEFLKQGGHPDIKDGLEQKFPGLFTPSYESSSVTVQSSRHSSRTLQDSRASSVTVQGSYGSAPQTMDVQPLLEANILATYGPATNRLLLFDYDGTLTPIVRNPSQALLGDGVLEAIDELASNSKNFVWIVSGRNKDFLEQEFDRMPNVGLAAEHGAFMRYPKGKEWLDLCRDSDMSWKIQVDDIMHRYSTSAPGSLIDRKTAAMAWHYRNVDASYAPANQALQLQKDIQRMLANSWPVEIINGKCVIEARLDFVNKGGIARRLLKETRPDFVLCAGDDVTDEDMFEALKSWGPTPRTVFTVIVGGDGSRKTSAMYRLSEPREVIETIYMLNEADRSGDTEGKGRKLNNGIWAGSRPLPVPRGDFIRADPPKTCFLG